MQQLVYYLPISYFVEYPVFLRECISIYFSQPHVLEAWVGARVVPDAVEFNQARDGVAIPVFKKTWRSNDSHHGPLVALWKDWD